MVPPKSPSPAVMLVTVPVVATVQFCTLPEASTPKGYEPAEQLEPSAASAVAVEALPVKAAVMVPALKLPEVSRKTTVEAVLALEVATEGTAPVPLP